MGRTLFWYILKDLVRVCTLSCVALVGIMSFCGLLHPLAHHELPLTQTGWLFAYLAPVMSTYALPSATAFACAVVYARFTREEELNAARASGLSHLNLLLPAFALGLGVGALMLVMLFAVVPHFSLLAKRLVGTNVAGLMEDQIQRTHVLPLDATTVVAAEGAHVLDPDPANPAVQRLELIGPIVMRREFVGRGETGPPLAVTREFQMADRAVAYIRPFGEDMVLEVQVDRGSRFSRDTWDVPRVAVQSIRLAPRLVPSPIREEARFMTLARMSELYHDPALSRQVGGVMQAILRDAHERSFIADLSAALTRDGRAEIDTDDGPVRIALGDAALVPSQHADELLLRSAAVDVPHQVTVTAPGKAGEPVTQHAVSLRVRVDAPAPDPTAPDVGPGRDAITIEGFNTVLQTDEGEEAHNQFRRVISAIPSPSVAELGRQDMPGYLTSPLVTPSERRWIADERDRLQWRLRGEVQARSAFALMCVLLAITGAPLGILIRSANYLRSGAASLLPAALTIALIVTAQHSFARAEHQAAAASVMAWIGDALTLCFAGALIARMRRQ